MKRAELTAMVFGRLTVIKFVGKNQWGNMLWRCRCQCGKTKVALSSNLLSGSTVSCGCRQKEARYKHGAAANNQQTPEYVSWAKMHRRCSDKNAKGWKNYGGRGIKVSSRWASFKLFLEDMGKMPGPKYTLDRIDNDGDYKPGNCRWATRKEQAQNRRFHGRYPSKKGNGTTCAV